MKIMFNKLIKHDGVWYSPMEAYEVKEELAKQLVDLGAFTVVEEVEEEVPVEEELVEVEELEEEVADEPEEVKKDSKKGSKGKAKK